VQIFYSTKFIRQHRKLLGVIKFAAKEKELIFINDPFDPVLRTHKLSGELNGLYAFWIKYKFRIVFKFESEGIVKFYEVGNHDIYE
jgi:mRNA-degrading endonuclease YafQ of YafQ-DinJ toxin-antitoxin module